MRTDKSGAAFANQNKQVVIMQYQENRASEAREMLADMAVLLLTIVAIGIVLTLVMGWLQG